VRAARASDRRAAALPRRERDVSFWIVDGVSADEQRAVMARVGEPLLRDLAVLEDFRDARYTPAGKKGMLLDHDVSGRGSHADRPEVDGRHAAHRRGVCAPRTAIETR